MLKVNIADAKAKLSEYLELSAQGEQIVICKHNRPVAELRALQHLRSEPRPVNLAAGQVEILESFFDPLPDSFMAGFLEGEPDLPVMVAEDRPVYGGGPRHK